MNMAWMRALALGGFVALGAPMFTTYAQDKPEGEAKEESAAPTTAKEVIAKINEMGKALGRGPSDEQVAEFFSKAWAACADYAKANPKAEDMKELHTFASRRASYGKNHEGFLLLAKDYLAKNPEAKDAADVRKYFLAGSLGNDAFKKDATAELKKIDDEAKKDAGKALLASEIRLIDASNRGDDAAKSKVIEGIKSNKLIAASDDVWVGRDAMRIVLSSTKVEIKEGEKFPCWSEAFPVKDIDGKEIKLADFKGKVVLLDFWAVWCGPCIGEMPNVVKAYADYHDKGFDVIGLSFDQRTGEQGLRDTIAGKTAQGSRGDKTGVMPWRQVYDGGFWSSGMAKRYGVNSIPLTVLIDGEGKVIAKNLRGAALGKKLAELLDGDKADPNKSN